MECKAKTLSHRLFCRLEVGKRILPRACWPGWELSPSPGGLDGQWRPTLGGFDFDKKRKESAGNLTLENYSHVSFYTEQRIKPHGFISWSTKNSGPRKGWLVREWFQSCSNHILHVQTSHSLEVPCLVPFLTFGTLEEFSLNAQTATASRFCSADLGTPRWGTWRRSWPGSAACGATSPSTWAESRRARGQWLMPYRSWNDRQRMQALETGYFHDLSFTFFQLLGKISQLTNIFGMALNHQLDKSFVVKTWWHGRILAFI